MGRTSNSFSATVVGEDGHTLIVLTGELDMDTVPDLDRVLDQLIEQGPKEVVLDFSGLSFVDSSGIAALISAQKRLNGRGRRLIVQSAGPLVTKVFEVTDLMEFLNVRSDQSVE